MLSLNDGCGKSSVTGNEWIGVKFIASTSDVSLV